MKELRIYPHVVEMGFDLIEDADGTLRFPVELDAFAKAKRFTDAELAAEVWVAHWVWERAEATTDDGAAIRIVMHRAQAIERFATLPHYDED